MSDTSSDDIETASAAVGYAIAAWSSTEIGLARFFSIISNIPTMDRALAVIDTIISFETRLQVCNSVMRLETASDEHRCMWEKFSARLLKLYKRRHRIAHFSFVTKVTEAGHKQGYVSPFFNNTALIGGNEPTFLGVKDIQELEATFFEATRTMHWFMGEAAQRRGNDELAIRPEPEQVQRLRDLAGQTLRDRAQKALQDRQS